MTISLMSHGMVSYLYQQKPEASQALRLVSATHQWNVAVMLPLFFPDHMNLVGGFNPLKNTSQLG